MKLNWPLLELACHRAQTDICDLTSPHQCLSHCRVAVNQDRTRASSLTDGGLVGRLEQPQRQQLGLGRLQALVGAYRGQAEHHQVRGQVGRIPVSTGALERSREIIGQTRQVMISIKFA